MIRQSLETSYTGYSLDCQVHVNINEIPSPFHCHYIEQHKLNTRTKSEMPILCGIWRMWDVILLFICWSIYVLWFLHQDQMLSRHHHEAESLYAVQTMNWEWKLKECGLCDYKSQPSKDQLHVPMVHVNDDADILNSAWYIILIFLLPYSGFLNRIICNLASVATFLSKQSKQWL